MKRQKKDYLMANIQVVSFQKKLLKRNEYEELLETSNWLDLRRQLEFYQDSLPQSFPTVEEVDQFYRKELRKLRDEMKRLSVDDEKLALLFIRKNSVLQVIEGSLASVSQVDETILKQYAFVAENSDSQMIQQFAKYQIDTYFLQRYLRVAHPALLFMDEARGNLSKSELEMLYGLPKEQGLAWLRKSNYHQLFTGDHPVEEYLVRLDQENWQILKPYRYQVRGIEGIFVYLYEKISELYNLRLILKGKIYRLPMTQVKKKMRWLNV